MKNQTRIKKLNFIIYKINTLFENVPHFLKIKSKNNHRTLIFLKNRKPKTKNMNISKQLLQDFSLFLNSLEVKQTTINIWSLVKSYPRRFNSLRTNNSNSK